ncbi:MAG: hypothetical protein V8T87_10180 [Victivallales bacterium]
MKISIPPHGELFPPAKTFLRKSGGGRDRIADFIESRAEGMSRQFISFCRAIKEATNDRVLAGGYRAEGAPVSYPFLVQQCSRRMYAAPEVDFFASCPGGRTPENPVMPSLLNGSLRLHNKLAVTELDFRTPWVGNWSQWGKPIYYKTHDAAEFRQRTMRAQLFASAFGGAFMPLIWTATGMILKWRSEHGERTTVFMIAANRGLSRKTVSPCFIRSTTGNIWL